MSEAEHKPDPLAILAAVSAMVDGDRVLAVDAAAMVLGVTPRAFRRQAAQQSGLRFGGLRRGCRRRRGASYRAV